MSTSRCIRIRIRTGIGIGIGIGIRIVYIHMYGWTDVCMYLIYSYTQCADA